MMTQELVYNAESKERLDKYLTAELHDCSRTQIQKLIKGGKILVNGSAPTPHHFLKKGDRIVIEQNGPAGPAAASAGDYRTNRRLSGD